MSGNMSTLKLYTSKLFWAGLKYAHVIRSVRKTRHSALPQCLLHRDITPGCWLFVLMNWGRGQAGAKGVCILPNKTCAHYFWDFLLSRLLNSSPRGKHNCDCTTTGNSRRAENASAHFGERKVKKNDTIRTTASGWQQSLGAKQRLQ
jgi:hypothetical protein